MRIYKDDEILTPEAYLLMEDTAEYKSEYHDGKIFVMAGGTPNHNHLCNRMGHLLENALEDEDCMVMNSDQKVFAEDYNSFMYPDVTVYCGELQYLKGRKDTLINPILIIEILSNSTKEYDWGGKLMKYKSLPSFKEYVTVSSDHCEVIVFFKQDESYRHMRTYMQTDAIIPLQSLGIEISMAGLYKKIKFTPANNPTDSE